MRCEHCGGPILAQHESYRGYRPAAWVYACAHCGRVAKEEPIAETPRAFDSALYGIPPRKNGHGA